MVYSLNFEHGKIDKLRICHGRKALQVGAQEVTGISGARLDVEHVGFSSVWRVDVSSIAPFSLVV